MACNGEAAYPSEETIKKSMSELAKDAYYVNASDIALQLGVL